MAYAFNALDNYFKRTKDKTAGAGDLQKGAGTGAPPPTAAADGLAKRAETSGEMGNSASRFEAMQKGPVGSIASRLAEPGRQKAASWQAGAEQQGQQYKTAGEKQMKETFKDFDPNQVGKAEAGEEGATTQLGQQLGYGNTSFDLAPMQIETPTLDTTSMLRSGVGGLQAALQKRGGRYTPGMAAMDASALAANRGAVQQLQGQFGNIQQGMREKAGELRGLEGQLEAAGKQRGQDIAGQVREALTSRSEQLNRAMKERIDAAAREKERTEKERARGKGKEYGGGIDIAPVETGRVQYTEAIDPGIINLANLLGISPEQYVSEYGTFAPDYAGIDQLLAPPPPPIPAPVQPATSQIGPTISPAGQVTPPTPGVIAVSGGSPIQQPSAPSAPTPSQQVKPTMPIAGMPLPGALGGPIPAPQQPATPAPQIPAQTLQAMTSIAITGTGTHQLSQKVVSDYFAKTGSWPTAAQMKNYKLTGRWG